MKEIRQEGFEALYSDVKNTNCRFFKKHRSRIILWQEKKTNR